MPPDRYSHPACPWDPPAPTAADVTVNTSSNGGTVHLIVGQRLGVQLTAPSDSAETWADVSAGGALYRTRLYVGGYETDAVFVAERVSTGEQVSAATDLLCRHQEAACASPTHTWSVTVVVDEPSSTPSPSGSADAGCYAYPPADPSPGVVVLTQADSGRTVQATQGDRVQVYLGGSCPAGGGWQPATAGGPLYRDGVDEYQPGASAAYFRAVGTGATTISAGSDAPCLHAAPSCEIAQQAWSVTVQIAPVRCTLTGPSEVRSGSEVPLAGTAAPGGSVQIWFRRRGEGQFVPRRTVTAGSDGTFTALYAGYDDYRWYATAGSCTSAPGLTRVTAWISGPSYARRGAGVPVAAHGPAGVSVALYLRPPGGSFRLARTGRLSLLGRWQTSYVAVTDERYYAATGPDRRTTDQGLTQLR